MLHKLIMYIRSVIGQKELSKASNAKASAIQKAHLAYQKATEDLPTDPKAKWSEAQKGILQDAKDEYTQAVQDAENAYEAKVADSGGSAPHQDVTAGDWARGEKPASSSTTPPAEFDDIDNFVASFVAAQTKGAPTR